MKIDALMLDPKDNVITCVRDVAAGETVVYRCKDTMFEITAKHNIPFGHKIALTDLDQETAVLKYGEMIGRTLTPIEAGGLVDHTNIYSVPRDYEQELIPI